MQITPNEKKIEKRNYVLAIFRTDDNANELKLEQLGQISRASVCVQMTVKRFNSSSNEPYLFRAIRSFCISNS